MSEVNVAFIKPLDADGLWSPLAGITSSPELVTTTAGDSRVEFVTMVTDGEAAKLARFINQAKESARRYRVEVWGVPLPGVYRKIVDQHGVRLERDLEWEGST